MTCFRLCCRVHLPRGRATGTDAEHLLCARHCQGEGTEPGRRGAAATLASLWASLRFLTGTRGGLTLQVEVRGLSASMGSLTPESASPTAMHSWPGDLAEWIWSPGWDGAKRGGGQGQCPWASLPGPLCRPPLLALPSFYAREQKWEA